MRLTSLGILGGTFNPIHLGHLRAAIELGEKTQVSRVHMIPCALPPHRETPSIAIEHRIKMLQLAIASAPLLILDTRELQRSGPSYTLDTLNELNQEYPHHRLFLFMGMDSFASLDRWHRFETLFDKAHIIVAKRPNYRLPLTGKIIELLQERQTDSLDTLYHETAGRIKIETITALEISATKIRELVAAKRSAQFLTPDTVCDYIEQHELYRSKDVDFY